MATKEERKKMYDFFLKETPDKGCMLCKVVYEDKMFDLDEKKEVKYTRTDYFLVEKRKVSNGDIFLLNGNLSYDYEFLFDKDWKIIYKHIEG